MFVPGGSNFDNLNCAQPFLYSQSSLTWSKASIRTLWDIATNLGHNIIVEFSALSPLCLLGLPGSGWSLGQLGTSWSHRLIGSTESQAWHRASCWPPCSAPVLPGLHDRPVAAGGSWRPRWMCDLRLLQCSMPSTPCSLESWKTEATQREHVASRRQIPDQKICGMLVL